MAHARSFSGRGRAVLSGIGASGAQNGLRAHMAHRVPLLPGPTYAQATVATVQQEKAALATERVRRGSLA